MEAFAPTELKFSHYSKEVTGSIIGGGVLVLVLCIAGAYIHHRGGPTGMLRAHRKRRDTKRKARDIEMAEAADRADRAAVDEYKQMVEERRAQEASDKAGEMLTALWENNHLVGSAPELPRRVDFDRE